MKKFLCLMLALFSLFTLTACSNTPETFEIKKIDSVYEEFLSITESQNLFINNVLQNNSINNSKNLMLKNKLQEQQGVNDSILLVMPLLDMGQFSDGNVKTEFYGTSQFTNPLYKSIALFQISQQPYQAGDEVYIYTMESGTISINYELKTSINGEYTEFKINLNFQNSANSNNDFTKFYNIRYNKSIGYYKIFLAETETAPTYQKVEYYSLLNSKVVSRLNSRMPSSSTSTYTTTDIVVQNYDGRLKMAEVDSLKDLGDISELNATTFAKINQEDRKNTRRKKYAYEIISGEIKIGTVNV